MSAGADASERAGAGLFWPAAILALCLKLLLAASTAGSNDAITWEHNLITLRTAGFAELYRSGVQYDSPDGRPSQRQAFIHPPAVLHGLRLLGALQEASGWPLRFWLRAAGALADLGTLMLLRGMFRERRGALLLLALSPVSILISGFHGNTDPIMMFFLVAAVCCAGRERVLSSGSAFGFACSVKLIPVIFAAGILLHLRDAAARSRWASAAVAVWIALALPYLAQEPALILRSMLAYSGATGLWGLSLISTVSGADRYYLPVAKWIAVLGAAGLPLLWKRTLFAQAGLSAFSFLLLSPAFGLQYLAWTIPWTVLLSRHWMRLYMAVTASVAIAVYAAASEKTVAGLYADLLDPAHFPALILMGIVSWILIAAITLCWAPSRMDKEKLWED